MLCQAMKSVNNLTCKTHMNFMIRHDYFVNFDLNADTSLNCIENCYLNVDATSLHLKNNSLLHYDTFSSCADIAFCTGILFSYLNLTYYTAKL